jgi:murein DD-endopeptidase MepM/ murein hydrolase activator NlpD
MSALDRRRVLQTGVGALALWAIGSARASTALTGPLTQGTLLRGRTAEGASVLVDGRKIRVSPNGNFTFGVAWDRKTPVNLTIHTNGDVEKRALPIEVREYKVQRIDKLPDKYVTPDKSVLARIARDNRLIGAARAFDTGEEWFADGFDWPVTGILTGVYGSRRILNGEERQPHFGVDIAAPEGRAIKAPQAGVVRMAEGDLYYTGATAIIDHGHGVSTSYLHMSRMDVEVGQTLKKGDTIGLVGKTGRATGPHLCWRLNWFAERLDASLIVPKMPA